MILAFCLFIWQQFSGLSAAAVAPELLLSPPPVWANHLSALAKSEREINQKSETTISVARLRIGFLLLLRLPLQGWRSSSSFAPQLSASLFCIILILFGCKNEINSVGSRRHNKCRAQCAFVSVSSWPAGGGCGGVSPRDFKFDHR